MASWRMNKTDRELLEAAAKAVGYSVSRLSDDDSALCLVGVQQAWNPLTDDGDALRLAVNLNIDLMNATPSEDGIEGQSVTFPLRGDFDALTEWHYTTEGKMAATRRAIVRAAAAIGETT
jgi:hypothetical protein